MQIGIAQWLTMINGGLLTVTILASQKGGSLWVNLGQTFLDLDELISLILPSLWKHFHDTRKGDLGSGMVHKRGRHLL